MKTPTVMEMRRRSLGLSRYELAKRVGASESTVANWETRANTPRHLVAERISRELGVPSGDLLSDSRVNQKEAAEALFHEMEMCGDVGDVDVLFLLDSLACAGLRLDRGGSDASVALLEEVAA